MAELFPNIDGVIPSDEELISVWGEKSIASYDPLLTDEEVWRFISGGFVVENPIAQEIFNELDIFKLNKGNFWMHFDLSDKFDGFSRRRTKAFQRFVLRDPALALRLCESITACQAEELSDFTVGSWVDMLEAYKIMAELVDSSDSFTFRDNGVLDRLYLTR